MFFGEKGVLSFGLCTLLVGNSDTLLFQMERCRRWICALVSGEVCREGYAQVLCVTIP